MKCEVCSELLEEYLDGELAAHDRTQIDEHLIECAGCSATFATLSAEQQLFARYDRELEVPPFLWTRVAAHTVAESQKQAGLAAIFTRRLASAIAILLLAIAVGVVYLIARQSQPNPVVADSNKPIPVQPTNREPQPQKDQKPEIVASQPKPRPRVKRTTNHAPADQSDVLSSDLAYLD